MRVRCTANADFRANAVGTLELEPTDLGLVVTYLSVGSYREGYAPGPAMEGREIRVPWAAVRATRPNDHQLLLSFEDGATPLNRFALSAFTRSMAPTRPELRRRRWMIRVFCLASIALTLVGFRMLLPEAAPHAGARLAIGIAVSAALLILLVGVAADQWLSSSRASSETLLAELWEELAPRQSDGVPADMLAVPSPPSAIDRLQTLLPRSAVGIAITLAATSLAALLTTARLGTTSHPTSLTLPLERAGQGREPTAPPSPARDEAVTAAVASAAATTAPPEPPPTAPALAPTTPRATLGESCHCQRHDSPLWREIPPRLSPLLISRRDRPHAGHQHVHLQLAVVNNGDQTLRDLHVSVLFHEQAARGRNRPSTVERPLYFAGPLLPGRAIKWRVEGRGERFEVLAPDLGTIEIDGSDAAPAESFVDLTRANHRPVRLHAAMMLAFLGDERVRQATLELRQAMREEEAAYLNRVAHASTEVGACALEVGGRAAKGAVARGCLYNASRETRDRVELTLRGLDSHLDPRSPVARPPFVTWERRWRVDASLQPGEGRRFEAVATDLPRGEKPAVAHELVVASEMAPAIASGTVE